MLRMIRTIAAITVAAVAASVILTGCEASQLKQTNENPLLGNWTLANGPTGCSQRLAFTEKQERAWIGGQRHDMDVTEYLVQPDKTYAIGSAGPDHAIAFEFLKHDRMMLHGSEGVCVWDRE